MKIPQHNSFESVTDVRCLLNIALAGAGVVEGLTSKHDDTPDVLDYLSVIGVHSDSR